MLFVSQTVIKKLEKPEGGKEQRRGEELGVYRQIERTKGYTQPNIKDTQF